MFRPIDQEFFNIPTLKLAQAIVGQYMVHETEAGILAVRIVETEAYQGPEDRAAHSFGNRKTKRTRIMFEEAGMVYTYQMHTHTLMNVVSGPAETPHAILIRAGEPVVGEEFMRLNRGEHIKRTDLTNGPGKLSKAMGVTMEYYGRKWYERPLYLAEGPGVSELEAGPRVGIQNTGEAVHYPWRFFEKGNPFVSKYR